MKKNILIILNLFLFVFISCEDESIPAEVETIVYGRIFDSTNNIPIINEKIKLAEFRTQGTFAGTNYIFKGFVASTTTNSNGDFVLPFKTSGDGNKYQIQVQYNNEVHIPNLEEFIKDENIGGQEEFLFEALRLYPVDLRIITTDQINQQISVYKQFPERTITPIPPSTQNSIKTIWIDKNVLNKINFRLENSKPVLNHFITIPLNNTTSIYEYEVQIKPSDFQ